MKKKAEARKTTGFGLHYAMFCEKSNQIRQIEYKALGFFPAEARIGD